jgi:alkylation response protein AidB-like acyl-CoA dehydrogenase
MNFSWTDIQITLRGDIVRFAQAELNEDVFDDDLNSRFPRAKWDRCAEFGLAGLMTPIEFGGQGHDVLTTTIALEGLGYGCRDNGLAFAVNGQIYAQQPIIQFGSELQKQNYLPDLASGTKICAFAVTEPDAGSDLYQLKTEARKVDGGYRLDGEKCLISFAPISDYAFVVASVAPEKKEWGLSAFLVDVKSQGVKILPMAEKMGLRTVPLGGYAFKDCFVPEENRVGAEGSGAAILRESIEWDRCIIMASQLGAMERQLDDCIQFSRDRIQFGQQIGKFQSVSNRIAEMKVRLETAKLLLYKVAWLKQNGKSALLEAAMCKLHLSECFAASSLDAIRIHGGAGYLSASEVERDLRDSIGGLIYGGTSDIQHNTIAKLLGL